MKTTNFRNLSGIGLLMLAAIVLSLSGCAVKKAAWGSLEKGMIMSYNAQPDRELAYKNSSDYEQQMTVMDQEFTIIATTRQHWNMMPLLSKDNNLEYVVTVGEMSSVIETPRGTMEADMDDVIGKSFNLTVSKSGIELEFSGAEALTYNYGMGQSKSIASDIQGFFPDLPDHPVRPGDSWESIDNIIEESGSNKVNLQFNNIHTFDKLETFNGYECMKVNVVFTGIISGEGEEEGMKLLTTGKLNGTSTWYYAFKEGIMVSYVAEGTGATNTEVLGPQEMIIPATRTYVMKSTLQ